MTMLHILSKLRKSVNNRISTTVSSGQAITCHINMVNRDIQWYTRDMECLEARTKCTTGTTKGTCKTNITSILVATQTRLISMVTPRILRGCPISSSKDIRVATKLQVPYTQWTMELILLIHLNWCISRVSSHRRPLAVHQWGLSTRVWKTRWCRADVKWAISHKTWALHWAEMIRSMLMQELPWCNIRARSINQIWVQCALPSTDLRIMAKVIIDSENNQALWCQGCSKIMACSRSLRWDSAGLSCRCKGNSRRIAKLPPIWDLYPQVVKDRKTWTARTRQKIRTSIFLMKKMTISKPQQFKISHQHQLAQLKVQERQGFISAHHNKSKKCLYIINRIKIETDKCLKEELLIFWQTKSTKKIKKDALASRWSKYLHSMTVQLLSINSHQKLYLLLVSGRMRLRFVSPPQTQTTNLRKKRKKSRWIKSLQSSQKLIGQD